MRGGLGRCSAFARPCQVAGLAVLVSFVSGCGLLDALQARRTARDGNRLYRAGDDRGAIQKYREALALAPGTPNVNLNLGFALFNVYDSGSTEEANVAVAREACEAFERHLVQAPGDEKATAYRIKMLLRAAPNDPSLADEAFRLFEGMLKERPDDQEVRQYLVSLFVETRRYADALKYFEPRLVAIPGDVDTMKILAVIADRSGDAEAAMDWYQRRADVTSDAKAKAELLYELGTYVWNLLHYQPDKTAGIPGIRFADRGVRACNGAIALQPEHAAAHVYANLLYLERAAREPLELGRDIDLRIAYELRQKAAALSKVQNHTDSSTTAGSPRVAVQAGDASAAKEELAR